MPDPVPNWKEGTPLEVVWDWEINHYCIYCFECLCEYCEGGPTLDGRPCECPHPGGTAPPPKG